LINGEFFIGVASYINGPAGMSYSRSDLNADGNVNANDWGFFYPNMLANLSAMTAYERAIRGDLDLDGDNDVFDFALFKADYDAVNGAGAFKEMLAGVPEPATAVLVFLAALAACASRSRRRSKAMALGLGIAAVLSLGSTARAVPLDLTTFGTENYPQAQFATGVWVTTPTTASLNSNADATVLYSPTNLVNKRITGTLTPGTDDDVVGFVLGFEPGDSAIGSSADYLLIDWKGVTQNFNFNDAAGSMVVFHNLTGGANMPVGLAISRVSGSANADELWQHADLAASPTGGVQQLARGTTLGSTPYDRSGGPHQFQIVYTENVINVRVDGVEQFHLAGTFPVGRFGLYSAWQGPTATFSDFEVFDDISVPFLGATVDRSNGSITLSNASSVPVDFDFYQFSSASNSLDDDAWNSLSEQNFQPSGAGAHQKWQEAGGSSSAAIAEVYLDGNSTLSASTSQSIGAAYNNLINGEDLVFQYRLVTGELRTGFVNYIGIAPGLAGDFNDDGKVDAADYVVWRKTDGSQAGYNAWRMNFGLNTGSGASLAGAASVPEPATCSLACLILLLVAPRRRGLTE
jgi:hypothetical protein